MTRDGAIADSAYTFGVGAIDPESHQAVGVARYIRTTDPRAAEVAVTVVDDWQGRGLGTLLLEGITMRAREEGVDTFTALMLVENGEMMDLLERLRFETDRRWGAETVAATVAAREGRGVVLRDAPRGWGFGPECRRWNPIAHPPVGPFALTRAEAVPPDLRQ